LKDLAVRTYSGKEHYPIEHGIEVIGTIKIYQLIKNE